MAELSPVRSVSVAEDGSRVAWGHADGVVRQWRLGDDANRGEWAGRPFRVPGMNLKQVVYSPDGSSLALVSDRTSMLALCDADSGESRQHRSYHTHSDVLQSVSFVRKLPSGDSTVYAVTGDTSLRLWNFTGDTCEQSFLGHERQVLCAQLSNDRRYIYSGSYDGTVRIWDVISGESLCVLEGHNDGVFGISVSPTDQRIAVSTGDGSVHIWDVSSGARRISRARLHRGGPAYCVKFDPSGVWIASGGRDGTVRLADTTTSLRRRSELKGHSLSVFDVGWCTDPCLLASGSRDGSVRLWGMSKGDTSVTVLDMESDADAADVRKVHLARDNLGSRVITVAAVNAGAPSGAEADLEHDVPSPSPPPVMLPSSEISPNALVFSQDPQLAIGSGAFGLVFQGLLEGQPVAVKVLHRSLPSISQESAAHLVTLRHPHIVQVLGTTTLRDELADKSPTQAQALVLELLSGGTLAQALGVLETAPLGVKIAIAGQVARGLAHLHAKQLAHGALSSANVLLDDPITEWTARSRVKLSDAGLHFILGGARREHDLAYLAPECINQTKPLQGNAALQADIFALGVQLWELFSAKHAWKNHDRQSIVENVLQRDERPQPMPQDLPLGLQDVINACWRRDPEQRPRSEDVVTSITMVPTAPPPPPT